MNYCFGDFEFTCGRKRDRESREMLSAGLIFYDADFHELHRFYKTVKPVKQPNLTTFCKELTGLTQEEIDCSEDSAVVCSEILALLDSYQVDSIYAMGPCDVFDIREDADIYTKMTDTKNHAGYAVADRIKDIHPVMKSISQIYGNETIGIQKFLDFYDICVKGALHNSLVDACALAEIYKHLVYEHDIQKTDKILEYEHALKEREKRLQQEREERARLRLEQAKNAHSQSCSGFIALRGDEPEVIPFRSKKERRSILSECQGISCQLFTQEQEEDAYLWLEQTADSSYYKRKKNQS
jgi:inhibitor of KinA sporulation pathway (predicted exonuclease)